MSIFFNKDNRKCNIYSHRPDFCKIKNLVKLFNIATDEFDNFAIKCCKEHIKDIYGSQSKEMNNFIRIIKENSCYNESIGNH